MRTPLHFLLPTIQTRKFVDELILDFHDGFIPLGLPVKFLTWLRNELWPEYSTFPVFNEHPLPTIANGELILNPQDGRIPFLTWISQELGNMSVDHLNLKSYIENDIPTKFLGIDAQHTEILITLRIIQMKIQENHHKIHLEKTKVFPRSIKMITEIKRQLIQNNNPIALRLLTQSIGKYQENCEKYIRSCRKLCLLFQSFLRRNPHMQQIKPELQKTIAVLVKEIKRFEFTISEPLQSLLSGRAEQTLIMNMGDYLRDNFYISPENFKIFLKSSLLWAWIIMFSCLILFLFAFWAFPL